MVGWKQGRDSPDHGSRRTLSNRVREQLATIRAWIARQPQGMLVGFGVALILVTAAALVVALGATDEAPAVGAAAERTNTSVQEPAGPDTASGPEELFRAAAERSGQAASYRFDGQFRLRTGSKSAELRLVGWVDGSDRELIVQAGGETLSTTRVIDAVATFDDGSGPREIAIEEAGAAPGFDLLEQVELVRITETEVEGHVSAEALAGFGLDDEAPKDGQVIVRYSRYIDGYTMWDPNGAWEIVVTFADFGGEVRS